MHVRLNCAVNSLLVVLRMQAKEGARSELCELAGQLEQAEQGGAEGGGGKGTKVLTSPPFMSPSSSRAPTRLLK